MASRRSVRPEGEPVPTRSRVATGSAPCWWPGWSWVSSWTCGYRETPSDRAVPVAAHGGRVELDGESAIAHARTGEFDLLLLDIGLPSLDGFEVLRRLRAQ